MSVVYIGIRPNTPHDTQPSRQQLSLSLSLSLSLAIVLGLVLSVVDDVVEARFDMGAPYLL